MTRPTFGSPPRRQRSPRRATAWRTAARRVAVGCALLGALTSACGQGGSSGGDGRAGDPGTGKLPPLTLRDDTPNLLVTWVDEQGNFRVVQRLSEVPEAGRKEVRVVVTTSEHGTGEDVYIADLARKQPDGTYPVTSRSRAAWDEVGASRRRARLEALAPASASAAPAPPEAGERPPPGKLVAIIYGASWCRPCHDAEAYLKQKGVTVVKKDIESSEAVAKELEGKLARARMGGASIPVIDIGGRLLVGFSPPALDRAITAARAEQPL